MAKDKRADRAGETGRIALVTGATSSLGREITKRLVEDGYEVRTIVKSQEQVEKEIHALPAVVRPYVADITLNDEETWKTLMDAARGATIAFHIAGISYNQDISYEQLLQANVIGTERIISAFADANRGFPHYIRFVFSSSVTVYGYDRRGEKLTEQSSLKPASNYSRSKVMAEEVIRSYAKTNPHVQYTILRLGTLYGHGYERSFFKVLRLLKEQKAMYIGSGENHLTLINVDDAAAGMIAAGESAKGENAVFNLTDGESHTVKFLFNESARLLAVPPPTRKINLLLAKVARGIVKVSYDELEFLASDRAVSTALLNERIGFRPARKIGDGIRNVVSDFVKRQGASPARVV